MTKKTYVPESPVCCTDHIQMTTEGMSKPMRQWNVHAAEYFFPHIGKTTYCVPPHYFNHQNQLTPEQAAKRNLIPQPLTSSACSNLLSVSSASTSSLSAPSLSASSSSQSLSTMVPTDNKAETGESETCDTFFDRNTVQNNSEKQQRPGCFPDQERDESASADASGDRSHDAFTKLAAKAAASTVNTTLNKKRKGSAAKSSSKEASSAQNLSGQNNFPDPAKEKEKQKAPPLQSLKRKHSTEQLMNGESVSFPKDKENPETLTSKPGKKIQNTQQHAQPVMLTCPSQESMMRRDKAMTIVLDSLQTLGKELEEEDEGGKGLFIISGVNYDNYLNRIPAHVVRECEGGYLGETRTTRGVLDSLVLHEHVGLMLIQVKSVGGNTAEWQASDSEMVTALKSVVHKVKVKSDKLQEDLSRELLNQREGETTADSLKPFHVLALPFIPRRLYYKMLQDEPRVNDYYELKVLCKEDFENSETLAKTVRTSFDFIPSPGPSRVPRPSDLSPVPRSCLHEWWKRTFVHADPRLSQTKLKEIVGRICGIFSSFTVQPDTKCRAEVRTFGHAVSETAARYSSPWLTIPQYNVLQRQDRFVVLSGPPGSGKSLLLTLKAVNWLEKGGDHHVALVNLSPVASSTQPHVRVLQEAIKVRRASDSNGGTQGHLLRITFPLNKISLEDVQHEVSKSAAALLRTIREARTGASETGKATNSEGKHAVNKGCIVVGEESGASCTSESATNTDEVVQEADQLPATPSVGKVDAGDSQEMNNSDTHQRNLQESTYNHNAAEKVLFILNEVDPNDEKSVRLLQAVRKHSLASGVWWSTSEPPGSQEVWSLYEAEKLGHVTRRPPHVQHVLNKLERRDEWRDAYVSSSVESGLPTEGPPVICIEHAELLVKKVKRDCKSQSESVKDTIQAQTDSNAHQYVRKANPKEDISETLIFEDDEEEEDDNDDEEDIPVHRKEEEPIPTSRIQNGIIQTTQLHEHEHSGSHGHSAFWCEACAEEVADVISRLVTDSANPKLSPFFVESTKFLKDPSKNRFGTAIKPRDVLIVTNFPDAMNEVRHRATDNQIEHLMQSTLVRRIREVIPLKILTEESGRKIAFPKNCAVLTDARNVRGLERKVVVYVEEEQSGLKPTYTNRNGILAENAKNRYTGHHTGREEKTHETEITAERDQSWNAEQMTNTGETGSVRSISPSTWTNCSNTALLEEGSQDNLSLADSGYCGDFECDIVNTSFSSCEMSASSSDESTSEDQIHELSMEPALPSDYESGPFSLTTFSEDCERDSQNYQTADNNHETIDKGDNHRAHNRGQLQGAAVTRNTHSKSCEEDDECLLTLAGEDLKKAEEDLPSWLQDKKEVNKQRGLNSLKQHVHQEPRPVHNGNSVAASCDEEYEKTESAKSKTRTLDDVLSKLSDVNQRGLYAAAACCLAQLVVVTA
ncbi:uncharacterized protein [Littorina saxatilis]